MYVNTTKLDNYYMNLALEVSKLSHGVRAKVSEVIDETQT